MAMFPASKLIWKSELQGRLMHVHHMYMYTNSCINLWNKATHHDAFAANSTCGCISVGSAFRACITSSCQEAAKLLVIVLLPNGGELGGIVSL